MKVTYNWLNEFIDIPVSAEELLEVFPKIGLEIDDYKYLGENLDNVVVGYVEECAKHPDADKLSLCKIDTGDEKVQIICGAPNVAQGKKVIVAKIGAILPGDFKIKKAKLRGVESFGMLCSLKELGLGEESKGIKLLSEDAVVGTPFKDYYGLDDTMYSLETFANRPDHLGVMGIARDLSVYFDIPFKDKKEKINILADKKEDVFEIQIKNKEACPRYLGRYVEGVKSISSPDFIQKRLLACGLRPIDLLVDITNYVMLETGHPMHAFDASQFKEKKVIIKNSDKCEFDALNENKYSLQESDLVIADTEQAVALAGIIGGANSEVKGVTENIFFESAYFEPKGILKTSRRLGLKTDSQARFEKHADVNMAEYAIDLACYLLRSHGGENAVFYNKIDNYPEKQNDQKVIFKIEELERFLGCPVPAEKVKQIINRLPVRYIEDNTYSVESCRKDLNIQVDMFEEIAKFYGYDNIIPETIKTERAPYYNKLQKYFDYSDKFIYAGFNEIKNFSLVGKKSDESAAVINPLNEDMAYMRTNMWEGLLKTVEYNAKRGVENHFYFEYGKVYRQNEKDFTEKYVIASIACGNSFEMPGKKIKCDFYYMKGIMENVLSEHKIKLIPYTAPEYLHPGMCAQITIDGLNVGYIGKLHPSIKSRFFEDVYYFEFYPELLEKKQNKIVKELSVFPASKFDFSLVVPDTGHYQDIIESVEKTDIKELDDIYLYDMYRGENIPEGHVSLTFRMYFSHPEKTMNDEEINSRVGKILKDLEKCGIELRKE